MIFIVFFFFSFIIVPAISQPLSCTPGFYHSGTVCHKCNIGSYCPDGKIQLPCPPGSYTDLYEQSVCRQCRSGWYQIQTGQTTCIRCGLGKFCPNAKQLPQLCPAGTYADLYEQVKCRSCPKGYYNIQPGATYCTKCLLDVECFNSSISPRSCADGFYNPLYAQTKCRRFPSSNQTIHIPGCFNVNN
ncbi:hypothetical protein I4U23_027552 [Adineta vaga]|nr:hypothetical protein I4U23_027552 [Adineta vaga]